MNLFEIAADYETPNNAGAGGMYQLESVQLNGVDVTDQVDVGLLFNEELINDLEKYLADTFEIPSRTIEIEWVD